MSEKPVLCWGKRCVFPRCLCADQCDVRKARVEQLAVEDIERATVPNRLYGAEINQQGEAI